MTNRRPPSQNSMVRGNSLFEQTRGTTMVPNGDQRKAEPQAATEASNSRQATNQRTSEAPSTHPSGALPVTTTPVKRIKPKDLDPRMVKLDNLPSLFIPYSAVYLDVPFTELYIRPLEWSELELIAKANSEGRVEYLMQAIDATISQDVEYITIPDFFFILYWQRLNSYPSTPYYMPWTCDEELPNSFISEAIDSLERITRIKAEPKGHHTCTHDNVSPLREKDLRIIDLEMVGWDEESRLDPLIDFPRSYLLPEIDAVQQVQTLDAQISDLQLLRENLESSEDLTKVEADRVRFTLREIALLNTKRATIMQRWAEDSGEMTVLERLTVPAIQWVKTGRTLHEKVLALKAEPDLGVFEAALAAEKNWKYGVVEHTKVNCGRCGAERHFKVTVSASTFLP